MLIKNILSSVISTADKFINKSKNNKNKISQRHAYKKEDQIAIISQAKFETRKLMNSKEFHLYLKVEKLLKEKHYKYRLFSQVSLGELFTCENKKAFSCINSKRADFVIINSKGHPVIILEYQGSGHHIDKEGNSFYRDTVKRYVCKNTNIEYLEFFEDYDDDDINRISKIISKISS